MNHYLAALVCTFGAFGLWWLVYKGKVYDGGAQMAGVAAFALIVIGACLARF